MFQAGDSTFMMDDPIDSRDDLFDDDDAEPDYATDKYIASLEKKPDADFFNDFEDDFDDDDIHGRMFVAR
ncbi:hypothetical protein DIPPA_16849 [Diplonema papillatum]|nr:hypothetical protein DIPPA_16849 [Diplonema papillatum]